MAQAHLHLVLTLLALLLVSTVGCGGAPAPRATPNSSDLTATDAEDDGSDLSEDDSGDGEDDAADAGLEDGEGDGEDDLTLDEIFAQCGGVDPDVPEKELLNLSLTALPIVRKGTQSVLGLPIPYTATAIAKLTINGSMQRSIADTAVTVTVEPSLGQKQGDAEAKGRSGPATTDMLTLDERVALTDVAPAWDGVACTVSAAKRVTNQLGSGTTVVSFAPALPSSVTPLPDIERFEAELAEPRTFADITATVETSTDPKIPVGSKHVGVVTVRKIDPIYNATLADGSSIAIGGDMAFEVAVNFGTPAITVALGLKPSTKFFIDNAARTYKAIVVETGEADTPAAVFIP